MKSQPDFIYLLQCNVVYITKMIHVIEVKKHA
jgi:hypothetical protein